MIILMQTCDELLNRWDNCQGGQILVDHTHPLKMYLNVNNKNNKELLVPVKKPITTFCKTEAIGINNYKHAEEYLFSIELLSEKLTVEYVCLCNDLIESSRAYSTESESSKRFFDTLKKWYYLLAASKGSILPINEIRGLMGELKYISDEIDLGCDGYNTVNAWTTHKDASRDFIYDDTWDEVKTIQSSGDYVTISSLEQLEHDADGRLIVYSLDRIDNKVDPEAYNLNSIISELKLKVDIQTETELVKKLLAKGYVYDQAYEDYIFKFNKKRVYLVNDSFPKLGRSNVSEAICGARYDILLTYINNWRVD